jgi:hypothetical protein
MLKFDTNKDKGRTSLGISIAYFSANGYTVSIPLNDTQDYDLVIEKDGILKTVQVKSTACKSKYGKYQVALKSCGGTKGKTYKTLIDTKVDLLCVITDNITIYVIPVKNINNRSTLNLCEKYNKYRVK